MKTHFNLIFTLLLTAILTQTVFSQSCTGVINTFPVTEDFENPISFWDQWTSAPLLWQYNLNGTQTPNTGPTAASNGTGYVYVEATNQEGSAVLLSPCFDLTSLTNPELTFDYHLYGDDAFRFLVQTSVNGGNTWGQIELSAINDQGPNWNSVTIDLSSYSNDTNVRFRFIGVVFGGNSGNDEGDVALDNIRIGEAPACFDISVSYSDISCSGANDGSATLLVYPANTTGLDILWSNGATTNSISNLSPGNYSVEVTDNASCTKTKNFTIAEAQGLSAELYITPNAGLGNADGRIHSIVSGGNAPYTYQWNNGSTGATNFNVATGYEELKITDANGCQVKIPTFMPNIELCSDVYGNWSYHLSFEGGLGRFKQGTDDDRNWKRKSGATPTANTGPTTAAQASKYRYIESSGNGGPYKTGVIVSKKCFDISNLPNPELYFQYHMFGADMGQLFVQTSTDGGYVWRENIWEISGDQGNIWKEAFIDLSGVSSSTLMIRIVGRTGAGNLSDIAIDDLHIRSAGTSLRSEMATTRSVEDITMNLDEQLISLVYPNPTQDILTINHRESTNLIKVLDNKGQTMMTLIPSEVETKIDLSSLNNGMYILQAIDENGKTAYHKVLKI